MATEDRDSLDLDEMAKMLRDGQIAQAQARLEDALKLAQRRHENTSFEVSTAHRRLGQFFLLIQENARAVDHLRKALRCDPDDDDQEKQLITTQNELADALERDGQLRLAEQAHLVALEQRAEFYGQEHHGYGFGLQWYARFLARKGNHARAVAITTEALNNLAAGDFHPDACGVIVLLARLLAKGGEHDPFSRFDLSESIWNAVGQAMGSGLEDFSPAIILKTAESYLQLGHQQLSPRAPGRNAVQRVALHTARTSKNYPAMRWYAQQICAWSRENNDTRGEQWATMEMSLAAEEEGNLVEAEALMKEGLRLANDLDDGKMRAHALRQLGISYSHWGRPEAEMMFRNALLEALVIDDPIDAGKTRVGLGIELQHQRRFDEAAELLREAVASLDPASPHAFCARNHLYAIESGLGCGCGNFEITKLKTIEALLRPQLPEGLLESVEMQDGQPCPCLTREATADELALLHRAWTQAIVRLRAMHG